MQHSSLSILLVGCLLITPWSQAQSVFTNASNLVAGSDNTGDPTFQPGTEVLRSTPGLGVGLASGGSYEHVGQFYVAASGIWNRSETQTLGTDYFGYAPLGIGTNTAYLGKGIKGASPNNGGSGVGRPTFGHLQLNSTGEFPLEGGMLITHSLRFNVNGPGQPSRITTPNATSSDSPLNAVVFTPTALIEGADSQNYIDGFASVTGVNQPFTLPVGDSEGQSFAYRPVTITSATPGAVTVRYRHTLQHSAQAVEKGVGSVSPVGNWIISAPDGTNISISLPALIVTPSDAATLRLVGWTGSSWVDLSNGATLVACGTVGCPLTGTIQAGITDVAIGSSSARVFVGQESSELSLTVWPNPTQSVLNVTVSGGKTIATLQALDLQSHPVTKSMEKTTRLDTSALPAGSYILEVQTTQGQTLRKHFVKQL